MTKLEQIEKLDKMCPLYTNHISTRELRHDFFEKIETEIQAYLLGFYAADGSVDEKRKTLRIHLKSDDCEIVNLFRDFISPNARTFKYSEHTTTGRGGMIINASESYGVDITSTILVQSLEKLEMAYKKTYKELSIPNIDSSLIKHFIRGYFDGDGTISGRVRHDKNRPNPRVASYFSITSKTENLLNEFQSWFKNNQITTSICFTKRDKMYVLSTASKGEVKKVFNLLYNDSNFYLTRKFDKFNYYVNTEVSQIIADHRNA